MTTPEIDVAPSTVAGSDKPGANSVTTPVDATRPCTECKHLDPQNVDGSEVFCGLRGEYVVPTSPEPCGDFAPTPVDAAPPKDPDDIDKVLAITVERARLPGLRDAAKRAQAAGAYLRARAEEERSARLANETELVRADKLLGEERASLARLRERVSGLAEALRGLLAACDDLRSAARTPDAGLPFGALRLAENEARSALRSLSPSTPETKDDHR